MPSIIDTMKIMGYSPDENGICFGIAAMSAQANLRKDTKTFINRINQIHNNTADKLKTISSKEKLDLLSFFDELSIYHGSTNVNKSFKKFIPDFVPSLSNLKRITPDTKDELYILPEIRKTIINNFTIDDFLNFTNELDVFLDGEPFSLIVTDTFENHVCHLGFDGKRWLSTNHDHIKLANNTKSNLRESILNIFKNSSLNDDYQKTLSVDIVLSNSSKTQLTDFKDFNFNTNKITQLFKKQLLSKLILSCVHSNNFNLFTELLDKINAISLSANETTEIMNFRNKKKASALFMAAQNGYTGIVKLLLDSIKKLKVDHNTKANLIKSKIANAASPLYVAAQNGHTDIVKMLLDTINELQISDNAKASLIHSKMINSLSSSLYAAAQNGHADIVKLLLDSINKLNIDDDIKADLVKERVNNGSFPLFIATLNGYTNIVKMLLDAIKNLKISNSAKTNEITSLKKGASLLFLAAQNGHTGIVKLLLDTSKELKINDNINKNWLTSKFNGDTSALFVAVRNGYTDITKLLVDAIRAMKAENSVKVNEIVSTLSSTIEKEQIATLSILNNALSKLNTSDNCKES